MFENLLSSTHDDLYSRWEGRLPSIISNAWNFATLAKKRILQGDLSTEKAIQDAYAAGFRAGYWEGVADIVDCGVAEDTNPDKDCGLPLH